MNLADGASVDSNAAHSLKKAVANVGNNSSCYMTDPQSIEMSFFQSQETSKLENRKRSRLVEISRQHLTDKKKRYI